MEIECDTLPILAAISFDETVAFYETLGFAVDYRDDDEGGYLILRNGPIELHFFPYPDLDPLTNYCGTYIRSGNVDAIYKWLDIAKKVGTGPDAPLASAPEDKPWNMREFHLLDPSRNLLRFGQAL